MGYKGRLLLVDDEPLVLEIFEEAFSSIGYYVVAGCSVEEALPHLERSYFDVVICDVNMVGLGGFDLLQFARRKNPVIEFILITGAPARADQDRAKLEGAHYLVKPVGVDLLLETVEISVTRAKATATQSKTQAS